MTYSWHRSLIKASVVDPDNVSSTLLHGFNFALTALTSQFWNKCNCIYIVCMTQLMIREKCNECKRSTKNKMYFMNLYRGLYRSFKYYKPNTSTEQTNMYIKFIKHLLTHVWQIWWLYVQLNTHIRFALTSIEE